MRPVERFISAGLCGSGRASHAAFARLVLGWDWNTAMWVGVHFEGFDLTPRAAWVMAEANERLEAQAGSSAT